MIGRNTFSALAFLAWGLFLTGCGDKTEILPSEVPDVKEESDALSYSGALVIGGPEIPWTGQSGVLVFTVVRNHSNQIWRGYPIAAAYAIDSNRTHGELIATGKGVLTSLVNREDFTPTDELSFVPGNDELEALTFIPVDFTAYPVIYVYWRFIKEGGNDLVFQQEIRNPRTAPHMTLSEARFLISKAVR